MKSGHFWSLWSPVLLYLALIFTLSQMSRPPIPDAIPSNLLHYPEFAVLGLLLARALNAEMKAWRPSVVAGWTFFITVSVGALDEFHQAFVPGRLPDVHDWLRDTIGTVLGILVWGVWRWMRRSSSR